MAWDSDVDTLDPAVFKSQGGYVTVGQYHGRADHVEGAAHGGQAGPLPLVPAEWDPHLAESWTTEDNGATMVFKIRRGMKFPSGRPINAQAFKYSFDRGLLSPGYMKLIFPTLIQVTAPEQFVVRDDYTFAIKHEGGEPDGPRHGGAVEQRHPRSGPGEDARHQGRPVGDGVAEAQHRVGRARTRSSRTSPASRS